MSSSRGSSSVVWVINTPMSMWIELAPVHQILGDRGDFVVGQPPGEQRHQRHPVRTGYPFGIAGGQPGRNPRQESVHCARLPDGCSPADAIGHGDFQRRRAPVQVNDW